MVGWTYFTIFNKVVPILMKIKKREKGGTCERVFQNKARWIERDEGVFGIPK